MTTDSFVIYAIRHIASGRRYIGSSRNYKSRWYTHACFLRHGRHHCIPLQRAWNKYGEDSFAFEILTALNGTHAERTRAELQFINAASCFNMRRAHTLLMHFVNSPETNKRISAGLRRRWADPQNRAHHSRAMKKRWRDPDARAVYVATIRRLRGSEEARAAQSDRITAAWADPNSGLRNRRAPRLAPKTRESKAEKMRAFWASPEGQAVQRRRKVKLRAYWADPKSGFRKQKRLRPKTPSE